MTTRDLVLFCYSDSAAAGAFERLTSVALQGVAVSVLVERHGFRAGVVCTPPEGLRLRAAIRQREPSYATGNTHAFMHWGALTRLFAVLQRLSTAYDTGWFVGTSTRDLWGRVDAGGPDGALQRSMKGLERVPLVSRIR